MENAGGLLMLGRSDGVLCVPSLIFRPCRHLIRVCRNPGGIRFGSAEIYEVLDLCFTNSGSEHISDYLAVGQMIDNGSDERVILFLKLPAGRELTLELEQTVRSEIRKRRSPRHVPAKVSSFHPLRLAGTHCGPLGRSSVLTRSRIP